MDARPRPAGAAMNLPEALRYDRDGLVPVVLQDKDTLEVLILAFMDRGAVERSLESGLVHLWSRSRGKPWLKGETSRRVQRVAEVRPNCELNSLLILVEQTLPGACHTGHSSCYYRRLSGSELQEVATPVFDPEDVYREFDVHSGSRSGSGGDGASGGGTDSSPSAQNDMRKAAQNDSEAPAENDSEPPAGNDREMSAPNDSGTPAQNRGVGRDLDYLRGSLETLLNAYMWLRDTELVPESSTSRILHGLGPDPFNRLREEWGELLGVLAGTHSHTGFREDAELEAYQVLYWTCLHSLAPPSTLHAAEAASALLEGYHGDVKPSVVLDQALHASVRSSQTRGLWLALGAACRESRLQPEAIVQRDLQELAARAYMEPHFTRRK